MSSGGSQTGAAGKRYAASKQIVLTPQRTIHFSQGRRRMNARPDIRQGICPQCGHDEIIEAAQAEFTGGGNTTFEMCVTYDQLWLLPGQNPRYGHGPLHLYVCRRCGFCQWYAMSPESIPVSESHRTRLIKGRQSGAAAEPA
jgi:hypothetical protein